VTNTYFDYLSGKHASDNMKSLLLISEQLTPEIEAAVEDVIIKMEHLKDAPLVDLAVITSLCFALVSKLKTLAEKDNEFDLTEDNMEMFAFGLVKSMFKS
jgi:hypothetical protein